MPKKKSIVKISKKEAWLYKNLEALRSLQKGINQALAGKVGPLHRSRLKSK